MPYPTTRTLIDVADEYARIQGWQRTTLSLYLFKDARRLDLMGGGADVMLGTFRRAMQYFSDNWPVEKAWPAHIERPSPSPRSLDDVPSLARRRAKGSNDGGAE